MRIWFFLVAIITGVFTLIVIGAWIVTWAINIAEKEEEKYYERWWEGEGKE